MSGKTSAKISHIQSLNVAATASAVGYGGCGGFVSVLVLALLLNNGVYVCLYLVSSKTADTMATQVAVVVIPVCDRHQNPAIMTL
jgi:hypothetical protein